MTSKQREGHKILRRQRKEYPAAWYIFTHLIGSERINFAPGELMMCNRRQRRRLNKARAKALR